MELSKHEIQVILRALLGEAQRWEALGVAASPQHQQDLLAVARECRNLANRFAQEEPGPVDAEPQSQSVTETPKQE